MFFCQGSVCRSEIVENLDALSNDDELAEAGVIVSSLHMSSSPLTSRRFDVPSTSSKLIFLKQGVYHKYSGSLTSFDDVKAFLLEGHSRSPAVRTPKPPSHLLFGYRDFEHLLSDMHRLNADYGALINVACVATGIFFMALVTWVLVAFGEGGGGGEGKKHR